MYIATFSVVGRSADGRELGVAVASRYLGVGAYVPVANLHGALATQANTNMLLRSEGLALLQHGATAQDVLNIFFAADAQKSERQAGIVDARGGAATYTGEDCKPWAGGKADSHPSGAYAIQGNLLTGPQVIDAMVDAWISSADEPFAWRLLHSLQAGESAGGDSRGKQASALYVVEEGKGFGGTSDIKVDLRCDDSPEPIKELTRLLTLHDTIRTQAV